MNPFKYSLESLPFYCSNKYKVFVDKNHDVYALQQTIYDELFNYLQIDIDERPKHVIKLCEEKHFTKLIKYKYTSNIPDYLKKIIDNNINNLCGLRKFVRDFEFETSWDFWDIIDYIVRNGNENRNGNMNENEINEKILFIPLDYYKTLISKVNNLKYLNITLNKIDFDVNNLIELVKTFKIDINKYIFNYNEAINHFKLKINKYPTIFKDNCDTTFDTIVSDGDNYINIKNMSNIMTSGLNYLITYSDKLQFDGITTRKYEIVYTPNVQIPLIIGTKFIYSPNEKYYLSIVKENMETQKMIKTKYGIMKSIQKPGLKYKKFIENYKYSKYLSDLVINESKLYESLMKEYSPTEVFEYDVRKDLKRYEIFKKYTKDSNTIVLLIHHLICFQLVEPDDKETYCLYKDMIYNLYYLQMSNIIEIISVCSFKKIYSSNKYYED